MLMVLGWLIFNKGELAPRPEVRRRIRSLNFPPDLPFGNNRVTVLPDAPEEDPSKVEIIGRRKVIHRQDGKIVYEHIPVPEPAPRPATVIRPTPKPYWEEHGWTRANGEYSGSYKTPHGSWRGTIIEEPFGDWTFLINEPPRRVLHGGHGACFFDWTTDRTKRIHFKIPPESVDAGIQAVEWTIAESFRGES